MRVRVRRRERERERERGRQLRSPQARILKERTLTCDGGVFSRGDGGRREQCEGAAAAGPPCGARPVREGRRRQELGRGEPRARPRRARPQGSCSFPPGALRVRLGAPTPNSRCAGAYTPRSACWTLTCADRACRQCWDCADTKFTKAPLGTRPTPPSRPVTGSSTLWVLFPAFSCPIPAASPLLILVPSPAPSPLSWSYSPLPLFWSLFLSPGPFPAALSFRSPPVLFVCP